MQRGSEFPADIHRVGNTHIQTEAAEGRMQMASIADQNHPALLMAVGDQTMRGPGIEGEDFNLPFLPDGLEQLLAHLLGSGRFVGSRGHDGEP